MATGQTSNEGAMQVPGAGAVDTKLEVITVPVSDIDRAKRFYERLGWRLDADFSGDGWRAVQLTPPGSPCSIHLGTDAVPGSAQGLFLVVDDIEAARADLIGKGVEVSEAFHYAGIRGPRLPGPDPERGSYRSYASFSDPDGNGWLLQEIKSRLPGRGLSLDVATLTELLQETEKRHGGYEPTAPKHHWSGWYAAYVVARERGRTPDEAATDATLHIESTLAAQA
jgi:catechol 2,3-dioxygenase-like lactoylglutathione lyase family enzyme